MAERIFLLLERQNVNDKRFCFCREEALADVGSFSLLQQPDCFCSTPRVDRSCFQPRRRRGGSEPDESDRKLSAFRPNQLEEAGLFTQGPSARVYSQRTF